MKYKVYLDELDEKSRELVSYSRNNIGVKIDELANVFKDTTWKGNASNKFITGYNQKINKLRRLNNNMEKLALFLRDSHNDYSDTNNSLNNTWNNILDEIRSANDEM